MKKPLRLLAIALVVSLGAGLAQAKLPATAPATEEAKAAAALAAAKTAWGGKVAAFQLCKSQDRVAAFYFKSAKAAGKDAKAPPATPACVDPGPFAALAPAPAAAVAEPAKKS